MAKTTRSIIMNYSHLESQKMESTLFTITPAYNKQYCTDNLQTNCDVKNNNSDKGILICIHAPTLVQTYYQCSVFLERFWNDNQRSTFLGITLKDKYLYLWQNVFLVESSSSNERTLIKVDFVKTI